ncbi:unnamed protein product [Rhizoctonia solani]|uniref:Uncharacterized protein n=1 Tax=Rhizoctonia solani TaxID=456999 RepID=A0A8H3BRB4_9AGAM|nr:hypothetical protein RHS01_09046 [Rhizoctonia solani]CAE6462827.1 unnamed protein product [Rhizoctonia solani]
MYDSIIPGGKYCIVNVGTGSYTGVGLVPPVNPPPPSPLKPIVRIFREAFTLEPKEGDKYIIAHKTFRMLVGHDDEGIVRLIPPGGKEVQWIIVDGYGPGRYRIKAVDSDKYWRMSREGKWGSVKLEEENGDSDQEWRFEEV